MRKHLLLFLYFIFFGLSGAEAQLYVGRACLANPNDPPPANPMPGSPPPPVSCNENTYFFDHTINSSADSWTWNFGDGTPERSSLGRNPSHVYSPAQVNTTVTVTSKVYSLNTLLQTNTRPVNIGYYPLQPMFEKKLRADTTICGGSKVKLDPYEGQSAPNGVRYKWFPNGETTSTIEVGEAGCYSVEVIDEFSKCSRFATITVKVCYEEQSSGGGSERWYFGHGSGMEFTMTGDEMVQDSLEEDGSLNPRPEIENPVFNPSNPRINNDFEANEAAAGVLNKGNATVLYTDGRKIFSGEDDSEIPNSTGASLKDVGAQGVAIVPKPVCAACDFVYYYVFTVDETTGILSYSVVDMRDNDRKGAVTESDIPLAVNMTTKMTVERGADDASYVVYAFDKNSNNFRYFTVDSVGVVAGPEVNLTAPATEISSGYVTVSPDQSILAHGMLINGENVVVLMSIDRSTNQLSEIGRVNLGADPATIYGLAFSPNGSLFYVTLQGDGAGIPSKLLQLDLSSGDPAQIQSSVKTVASGNEKFGAVALGPKYGDGSKFVYITMENRNVIHYLQDPDEIITSTPAIVGFTYTQATGHAVAGTTKLGFPNIAAPLQEDDGGGTGATYSGNCMNAPTSLNMPAICDPFENEVEWIVEGEKKTGAQVEYTFSKEGWHEIYITIKVSKPSTINISGIKIPGPHCTTILDTGRIYIKPAPKLTIPDPLYLCPEPPYNGLTYEPKPTGGSTFEYEWLTIFDSPVHAGYRDPVLKLIANTSSGSFKVKITNEFECATVLPFQVEEACEPIVEIPTAFTPNGDGSHDSFKLITHFIERPKLEIYNRWGEQVFQTDNMDLRWDGRYKGQLLNNQLFAYVLRYYARDFPQLGEQKRVGSVLVLSGQ